MNTPKFDLGAMLSAPQTAIQQIPCDQLHPYHNHKFELYSGERLEDMVASIKENGVLSPIIVQPIEDGYEILIGHNRWNASKLAGLPTVPAIVKAGLTEDEAEMYVIESNLIQRSFSDLKISEQAAVVASRHSKMFSPGKRNDIIRELTLLENPNAEHHIIESIISGEDGEAKPKPKSVKISNETYTKYFSEGVKAKEITETIEKALAFYFENMEEN